MVTISAEVKAGLLHLAVSDNGVGLPEGKTRREGIGLTNTRERLRQIFADAASMSLTNENGVAIRISLPYTTR